VKPEFVDNRNGNTLAAALGGHLDWLAETWARPVELSIATGYFNPAGFACIADKLERVSNIRLLLGAEPVPPPARPIRKPSDPRGERFEARLVGEAIRANFAGLVRDRDYLAFAPETDASLRKLLSFLGSGRIEVRRYESAFLHGKAFIFSDDEGVIAGSSNFTAAGLTSNLELNLGRYDPTPVRQVRGWFDDLWDEAKPFDLASVYAARLQEYDPYLIYLRVLWELYRSELEQEQPPGTRLRLTTFQNDGLWRADRILDEYNGVVIADGVGLGKTFIAGELMRRVAEDMRQRVLLVSPAALRDGMWAHFAAEYQIYLENISYEQLADEQHLGGSNSYLQFRPNEYAMIVVDEAQAFRNPDTRRAQALRRLLLGKPPKKLVLVSATPVNNSLWDMYYLLTLFVGHDAAFASRGIRSLKERFREAMKEDPYDLQPDMLFDVLDAVTVRRTRHFVKRYYPNERIRLRSGREVVVQFPEPHVQAVKYDLGGVLPGFFEEIEEALAPEEGDPLLTMAAYCPSAYLLEGEPDESQLALVGLIRSGLLKRFESSARAFALTGERMALRHDAFLAALDKGYIPTPAALAEWTNVDTDEDWEQLLQETAEEPTECYDVDRLREEVRNDRDILRRLAKRAMGVRPEKCPKLAELVNTLLDILRKAHAEGIDEEDIRDKRKVAVFSYFADTADWLEDYLRDAVAKDRRLADYRGRIVSAAGQGSRHGVSREAAVFGFVPESSEAPAGRDANLYDILVTTDVLAEGVNLQQCRNVINYDLPWNPMRLVQRHGRTDRIGSPHTDVFIHCFFPDKRLDALLNLESRVRRKLAQAAASIGVESEVLPGGATSDIVFSETRDKIDELRRENPGILITGGEDPTAHSGEEYRQELRKGLLEYDDAIKALPWAAGSGIAAGPRRGHMFCARVGERHFLRFVPLDDDEVVRDTLGCLKMITCEEGTARHLPRELAEATYEAWAKARRDIYDSWMFETDPANLQPRIRPFFRKCAEHLRQHPPPGISQEELDATVEALEAPWGIRHERAIKQVFDREAEDPLAASATLVEKVKELGLQPFAQPEPLPIIDEDEVVLICWMAVDSSLITRIMRREHLTASQANSLKNGGPVPLGFRLSRSERQGLLMEKANELERQEQRKARSKES